MFKRDITEDSQFLDPFALPYVTMSEVRYLPVCGGIYFAIEGNGNVVYIGQATNIRQRWRTHRVHADVDGLASLSHRLTPAWLGWRLAIIKT